MEGLASGDIRTVATNHSPHPLDAAPAPTGYGGGVMSAQLEFKRVLASVQKGPQIRPRPTIEEFRKTAAWELRRIHRRKQVKRSYDRFGCFALDQLRGLPRATTDTNASGVYFMWFGPVLTYIGKSVEIGYRLFQHRKAAQPKPHTHVTFLVGDPDLIRDFEGDLVRRYEPPYNFTSSG
jgi:hypothetical protein